MANRYCNALYLISALKDCIRVLCIHRKKIILYFFTLAAILYLLSFVGDLIDGYVARKFNQSSEYGGMLDMITDRCSTLGLLFVLSCEYRQHLHGHGGGLLSLVRIIRTGIEKYRWHEKMNPLVYIFYDCWCTELTDEYFHDAILLLVLCFISHTRYFFPLGSNVLCSFSKSTS